MVAIKERGYSNSDMLMGEMRQRIKKLEEALIILANPIHTPQTEEAVLLQIETSQIAKEALSNGNA